MQTPYLYDVNFSPFLTNQVQYIRGFHQGNGLYGLLR